jgi:DNA ligase (NAD+)
LIQDVADLYTLQKSALLMLEGFADKKADNLVNSIKASKSQPLHRLITALGMRGVGEISAVDIAHNFPSLDLLANASLDALQQIEGIGPNIASAILDWFSRQRNQLILKKLKNAGVWPTAAESFATQRADNLAGMTFVITGTLTNFTRDSIKEFIQQHGGKITDSVSRNTSYVLVGENPGSKLDKANQLNIPILSESDLLKMCA